MSVCFCTLAIHAPYRRRAHLLCDDAKTAPWIVLTDVPEEFEDLPVRAIRHAPTGPMAVDYLERLQPTGEGRGAAAYHDKRFALLAALEGFDTAIYVDADSRIAALPPSMSSSLVSPSIRSCARAWQIIWRRADHGECLSSLNWHAISPAMRTFC